MKKIISFSLILAMILGLSGAGFAAPVKAKAVKAKVVKAKVIAKAKAPAGFKDVKVKDPAYPYIMKMVTDYKVISGYPDNTFRGTKTINRAEFSKILTSALSYLEKKYDIPLADETTVSAVTFKDLPAKHWAYPFVSKLVDKYKLITGYPDGTYKPNKTITRFEMASVFGKTVKAVYARLEIALATPEAKVVSASYTDVMAKHWAREAIDQLLGYKILDKGKKFDGAKAVDRNMTAVMGAKLLNTMVAAIDKIPAAQLAALRAKYAPKAAAKVEVKPLTTVDRQMQLGKPRSYVSGLYGNVNESASSTNNWLGLGASASYANNFNVLNVKADYELTGKYGYNQLVYLVPTSGRVGNVGGAVVNESRYDVDLNTIYPIVNFYGMTGQLLLGLKYVTLSNSVSPVNFGALNAGVATIIPAFGTKILGRAFYSLLPSPPKSTSILGVPTNILNYEAGLDTEIMKNPVLVGFSGETMFIGNGFNRFYNMVFVRYWLL